jgi:hypothetical protein
MQADTLHLVGGLTASEVDTGQLRETLGRIGEDLGPQLPPNPMGPDDAPNR